MTPVWRIPSATPRRCRGNDAAMARVPPGEAVEAPTAESRKSPKIRLKLVAEAAQLTNAAIASTPAVTITRSP